MDVLGARPDGYHEVETVMQSISLSDVTEVTWEAVPGMGEVRVNISCDRAGVPLDERNLACKAVRLMEKVFGKRLPGDHPEGQVTIDIRKSIPVAAGLAGGSGNAASVVIALNELWDMGLSADELCGLSAGLGADVPFTLLSQAEGVSCALGRGIGDKLAPLENRLDFSVLLVNPGFGVSTAEVYRGIDAVSGKERTRPDTAELIRALEEGDRDLAFRSMANGLEDYTLKACPEVAEIKKDMKDTEGILLAMMSGSGPTVIGFYESKEDAERASLGFREAGYGVVLADKA